MNDNNYDNDNRNHNSKNDDNVQEYTGKACRQKTLRSTTRSDAEKKEMNKINNQIYMLTHVHM